jgi:hypothetical protein
LPIYRPYSAEARIGLDWSLVGMIATVDSGGATSPYKKVSN